MSDSAASEERTKHDTLIKENVLETEESLTEIRTPMDRGWAWIILFSTVSTTVIISGVIRSSGIFFLEITERFNRNNKDTAWIVTCMFFNFTLFGPVANAFASVLSTRVVVAFGGILMSLGLFLSVFAPSLEYLYLTYGIIFGKYSLLIECLVYLLFLGIGFSCIFTPTYVILAFYFNKYRSRANAIKATGAPLSSFLVPPLVEYLMESFGLRGTFLICSGILLNVCVFACLMRPTSYYARNSGSSTGISLPQKVDDDTKIPKLILTVAADSEILSSWSVKSENLTQDRKYRYRREKAKEENGIHEVMRKTVSETHLKTEKKRSYLSTNADRLLERLSNSVSLVELPLYQDEKPNETNSEEKATNAKSRLSPKRLAHDLFFSLKWSLWKQPSFLLISMSLSLTRKALPMCFMMLPSHVRDLGFSSKAGSMVIFWMGLPDIFSRLLAGCLADRMGNAKGRLILYGIYVLLLAIFWFSLSAVRDPSFIVLLILVMLIGTASGGINSLCPTIITDTVGVENLSSGLSFAYLLDCLTFIALPVFLGHLRDVHQNWNSAIFVMALVAIFGDILLIINKLWSLASRKCRSSTNEV